MLRYESVSIEGTLVTTVTRLATGHSDRHDCDRSQHANVASRQTDCPPFEAGKRAI